MGTFEQAVLVVLGAGVGAAATLIAGVAARLRAGPRDRHPDTRVGTLAPNSIRVSIDGQSWPLHRVDMYQGHHAWVDESGRLYDVDESTMTAQRLLPVVPGFVADHDALGADTGPAALVGVSSDATLQITPSSWAELSPGSAWREDAVGTLMDAVYADGVCGRAVPSQWTLRAERRVRGALADRT